MQLTVLGCLSGMPAHGQASSGYLVDAGATSVLLDCGPGIATALTAQIAPEDLDAVVISHLHSDHCYDLLPLGKALLHARARRLLEQVGGDPMDALRRFDADIPAVPLYVPVGGRAVFERLATLFPVATFPLLDRAFDLAFEVREYHPGDAFAVGACEVSMHPLRHTAPNCGTRIEADPGSGGGRFAYTGDTGLCEGLRPFASEVDMLLAEASLDHTDHGPHGHLSAADAGSVAAENGVGELVLTHFPSSDPAELAGRRRAAAAVFDGPVHLAEPAKRFPVRPAVTSGVAALRA